MSACKLRCWICKGRCATPLRDAYYRRLGELARQGGDQSEADNPFSGGLRDAKRWWAQGWRAANASCPS